MAETGSFSTSTGVEFNLKAYYSYTQNISTNKSEVTVTLKLRHNKISATALSGSYLSVAGNKVTYNGKQISQSSSGINETTLATKTVTVSHNSDGTGSCTIKADFVFNGTYSGKYIGTLSLNKTLTLDTIPRSSTFSVPSSVNTGSSLKVSITPSSSTFKHKVRFEIDGTSKYTSGWISAGTTSFSYTIPHSWLPSATSKTMSVYCYTYTSSATSDSDYIARVKKTTTVNVPSSVVPTISSVTPTIVSGLSGKYVQGKSKIKLAVSASGSGGSTIKSYIYTGQNINGSSSSYIGTSSTKTSSVIQKSGNFTYTVQVKDSRNRLSAKETVSISVEPYAVPQISSITVDRCLSDGTISSSGTYAYVTVRSSYSKVGGANKRTVVLSNSSDDYATSTTVQAKSNTNNVYSGVYGSGFALGSEYTIKATITDTAYSNTDEASTKLRTAERPFNIAKYGNGVAVGGLSTVTSSTANGKFECNWPMFAKDDITTDNELFTNGKTKAYDGKQGVCISNNGRIYLVGTTSSTSDAISPYTGGIVFAYNNATAGTSSIIETAAGELTFTGTIIAKDNVTTKGKFGSASNYSDLVFAMYCQWKDGSNHDLINIDTDGLTAGVGWKGSTSYSTVLNLRGQTVKAPNNSGVAVTSDERLKNSFTDLDKYESFFDKLHPTAFKYNDGSSGRYHIGFGAQSVEKALSESGLDNTHFGGILRYSISDKSEEYHGYDEEYGLIYNEFVALNTHMIQKLKSENEELKNRVSNLEDTLKTILVETKGE